MKKPKCGRKAATSSHKHGATSSDTRVLKTKLRSNKKRPKRSCSRAPVIKYTLKRYAVKRGAHKRQ